MTITFTGVPVSTSNEPACAANASGSRSCDGDRPRRTAITTTTGSNAATAPLTLISAVSSADQQHREHDEARPALAGTVDQLLAGPRGDSGRIERFADTKSEAMKITAGSPKPASAWLEVEDAGRPERKGHAERHERDRQVVPDEHGHSRAEHEEGDRLRRPCEALRTSIPLCYSMAAAMPSITSEATNRIPMSGSMNRIHLSYRYARKRDAGHHHGACRGDEPRDGRRPSSRRSQQAAVKRRRSRRAARAAASRAWHRPKTRER